MLQIEIALNDQHNISTHVCTLYTKYSFLLSKLPLYCVHHVTTRWQYFHERPVSILSSCATADLVSRMVLPIA